MDAGPEGTTAMRHQSGISRPFGTHGAPWLFPALKRRASAGYPFGTKHTAFDLKLALMGPSPRRRTRA